MKPTCHECIEVKEIVKKKCMVQAALALLLVLCFSCAAAQEAKDLTNACIISSPDKTTDKVHDGAYTSFWQSRTSEKPHLEFQTPEGESAQYLYICFAEMPEAWSIEEEINGEWQTSIEGTTDYYHVLVALNGKKHFRLVGISEKKSYLKLNEVFVFSDGELPDWVQQWEPTPKKADLLLLVAHPDDELIFFGGTIPTYAVEKNMNVVVAYMSYSNTTRRSELLNGLWHMGLRQYPVIGDFGDVYMRSLDDAYAHWTKRKSRAYITELIRQYKPDVMITHDINGEYGHGAHKLCANVTQYCVEHSGDETFMQESAEKWGTWTVKKLYLHMGRENTIFMDWHVPLESMGGKTGLELAQEAYAYHVTQQSTSFTVTDEGRTGNAKFSLVYSQVGEDQVGGDFFENLGSSNESTPSEALEPEPTSTPTPDYDKVTADVEWPVEKPKVDAYGYPLSGEYVHSDDENGLWFYASPTLVIRIDRFFDAEQVLTWYEAQVFCDLNAERVGSILYNPSKPQQKHVQASLIAKQNQVVWGMNTDYYTYRVGRKTITGMVIRDKQVFYDRVPAANRRQFPNLDTLAMLEDGSWRVFHSDEHSAQEYLDMGAVDVFSFGPYLIRDGEINPFIAEMTNGKTPQPRCAIGMVEPGHYYAVLAEGRIRNISIGVSIAQMAELMQKGGCKEALNLDGGQTAVMLFMGEQISRIGKYDGGKTNARATTEIIGVGHSDLIDPDTK